MDTQNSPSELDPNASFPSASQPRALKTLSRAG